MTVHSNHKLICVLKPASMVRNAWPGWTRKTWPGMRGRGGPGRQKKKTVSVVHNPAGSALLFLERVVSVEVVAQLNENEKGIKCMQTLIIVSLQ